MEHWYVVSGHGTVMLNGSELAVATGSAVDVPPVHRTGLQRRDRTGRRLEVRMGRCFGDDDIERLDDDERPDMSLTPNAHGSVTPHPRPPRAAIPQGRLPAGGQGRCSGSCRLNIPGPKDGWLVRTSSGVG